MSLQGRKSALRKKAKRNGIFGCPHDEVVDLPGGYFSSEVSYWAGRDRGTKERLQ